MTCNRVPLPGGGYALVCGPRPRRKKEKKAMEIDSKSAKVLALIERFKKASATLIDMGAQADALGLAILSREADWHGKQLAGKIEQQVSALEGSQARVAEKLGYRKEASVERAAEAAQGTLPDM